MDVIFDNKPVINNFLVNCALQYMEEHYRENLKLADVAGQLYVSQWYLSRLLNRYTNQNFSDILNGIRVEKAKELLEDSSLRISDVAAMVGFQSLTHFSKVFRKKEGVPAREYRNFLFY